MARGEQGGGVRAVNGWAHTITDTVRHVSCSDCCCTTPTPDPASPCGVCNQGTVMCFYTNTHTYQPTRCTCGHPIEAAR